MNDRTFLRIPINEWKRKAVHMGCFGFAFLLPYITPTQAVLGAIAAFCFSAFLLPKLMPSILRPDENGKATGLLEVILYPAAILATLVAFGVGEWYTGCCEAYDSYIRPVKIVWFTLAILDGIFGLMNRVFCSGIRLPWNNRKSFSGLVAGIVVATILTVGFSLVNDLIHYQEFSISPAEIIRGAWLLTIFMLIFITVAGVIESVWFGIADNLIIPFFISTLIAVFDSFGFKDVHSDYSRYFPETNWLLIICMPVIFGLLAWLSGKITSGGAVLGIYLAFLLCLASPWLFLFLLGFFILGVISTSYGKRTKESFGIAEVRGGRRGPAEIFGSAGVAAWVSSLIYYTWYAYDPRLLTEVMAVPTAAMLVIISPLIAKTMDTVSSEIGKAVGGKTISLMNFRLVPPGTAGAVSLAGTLWGIAAAALLAALIFPLHWGGFAQWGILIAIAIAANLFESYWGAWASPRGLDDGPHTNFLMTLFAAVLAWFVWGR